MTGGSAKTRVLIAEDDPTSLRLVEVLLVKWGYEPVLAHDGVQAWETLQGDDAPALAILDWMMPLMDGPTVCLKLRKQADRPYVYVLLLTAKTQEKDLIEGLRAGADDYLTKPFSPAELRARLFAGERIVAVQQQLTSAREALREEAIRDPLTGLFNRRYLEEVLGRELRRARHGDQHLSVLMLDLDHFKNFNDLHGHAAGDAVLKEVGMLLDSHTRREDVVCRYGGEEFVLILPGAPLSVSLRRADDLRQAVRECSPEWQGKALGSLTVSTGIACCPEHGTTPEELLGAADQAMYRAKREGRDCVVVYEAVPAPG
ncbi:MAG TPA: diguanylate cyclase [Terriglobia bacterium]|nr:diguanylate cyclase [Terriglobia bacterium]